MAQLNLYRFQDITVVLGAKELADVVLSRTQRKTPTEVHKQFKITRIRSFYMRKVKFTQQTFHDKLTDILTQFPKLDEIHPFYADLCNVLYDRDHYKIALGQVNAVRGVIDSVAKDYVRMMKYADSLYKCKMLKRAALGRMCTSAKKLQQAFTYLEEVRQHLARLPSINPHTRTLILAGYPNVGKSSFINAISHANVEVQPYAFTTKSLFVGHFDYSYTRWQVIDTPGILDRPLESRNTVEMTAITALAHIPATVLYVLDMSEQCGFDLEAQVALFHSIKPLFKNKPIIILLNKSDIMPYHKLQPQQQDLIQTLKKYDEEREVEILESSTLEGIGVDEAKRRACDILLEMRVGQKSASKRLDAVLDRLYVAQPETKKNRVPFIPREIYDSEGIVKAPVYKEGGRKITGFGQEGENGRKLERDLEEDGGGPGVFSTDLRKNYLLANPQWKYDIIPEVYNGKNVADFVDPDIEAKLLELEREEESLLREDAQVEYDDPEWEETNNLVQKLHKKIELQRLKNRLKRSHNKAVPSRAKMPKSITTAHRHLTSLGYDTTSMIERFKEKKPSAKVRRSLATLKVLECEAVEGATLDEKTKEGISKKEAKLLFRGKGLRAGYTGVSRKGWRQITLDEKSRRGHKVVCSENAKQFRKIAKTASGSTNFRAAHGLSKLSDQLKAEKIKRMQDKFRNSKGKAGEADRVIPTKMPKHLFAGKRGNGKTDRR